MQKSTSIKEIAQALGKFQSEVENVKKDATNPFFKSRYATLENVIETIREPLKVNGLSFAQFPDADGLTTIVMHESGEFIEAMATMTLKDHTPQGQGSGITYLRRYALCSALGLATEDDDGNQATRPAKPAYPAMTAKNDSSGFVAPVAPKLPSTANKDEVAGKERIKVQLEKLGHKPKTLKETQDAIFQVTGQHYDPKDSDNYQIIGDLLSEEVANKN